ncbi:hypothetical protein [Nonomuraea wenchangensis]|uniref:Uncharacterized protein n=1 Tax=Nonomuraea wenchangensis TaxID=568860 RepID=A0A1I0LTU2_9ACTN|nr:hypothetical protein [Nonomuraea wenchangensis]SEU46524.1 hypothetical protein SAMN05421811_12765 [Nonomuraea wenchangensis]
MSAVTYVVTVDHDTAENVERAARDLDLYPEQVLAMLAGRVEVESGGRLALSGECDEGAEAR